MRIPPLRTLVILALALTVACRGRSGDIAPSPATPDQTVDQFLAAVNATDLDRMSTLWGTERGPESATRTMDNQERIQRLTIIHRLLRSDSHTVTSTDMSDPSKRVLNVAMTQGTRRFAAPFTLVQSRAGGWLIQEIGLEQAMQTQGGGTRP